MPRAPTQSGVTRNIERWVVWPFSVVSGILGAVAIGNLFGNGLYGGGFDTAQLVAIGVITGFLTQLALRVALRATAPATVALATFGSAIFFAALDSPACFVAVSAIDGTLNTSDLVGAIALSGIFGLIYSLPLGCLWALALVGPMFVVAKLRQEPTLDGPDRAMRAVGGTLAVVCTFGFFFALPYEALPHVLGGVVAAGTVAVLVASFRLHRLDRFLRRVRRGEIVGWEIVALRDLDDLQVVPDDLPTTDLDHHPDAVLVRVVDRGGDGAYRTGKSSRIAWARTRL
jgi:hypothetical protein